MTRARTPASSRTSKSADTAKEKPTRAKKTAAKTSEAKATAKKSPAAKTTKSATAGKASAKAPATKKAAPKVAATKKAAPKAAATKKATTTKATSLKATAAATKAPVTKKAPAKVAAPLVKDAEETVTVVASGTKEAPAAKKASGTKKASTTKASKKTPAVARDAHEEAPAVVAQGPEAASAYRVDFGASHKWPSVEVGGFTYAGTRGRPELAEAGKPFVVHYHRSAADIGQEGELERIELFYRVDGGRVLAELLADGERDADSGLLVRRPGRVDVPEGALREVEYWFKLTTTDGRVLWDSDYGRNYRAEVVPQGDVFVVFEGVVEAPLPVKQEA